MRDRYLTGPQGNANKFVNNTLGGQKTQFEIGNQFRIY